MTERIWAPWRIEYIRGTKPEGCVFCSMCALDVDHDEESFILYRGERCFVVMNRYPYNNGHLMVVPYRHLNTPTDLTADELTEMMQLVNLSLEALKESMAPDGFNVGMNIGTAAGAGIKDHIHMHIVPRWNGDTNFMPVLGETRVIVEGMQDCYGRLRPVFARARERAS